MLALLGDRVDRGRIPWLGRLRHAERDSRVWGWVVARTLRHPVASMVVAAAALVALAVPALSMHTATPGVSDFPHDVAAMQAWDRLQQAFPGGPQPARVVVTADDVTSPRLHRGGRAPARGRDRDRAHERADHDDGQPGEDGARSSRCRWSGTATSADSVAALRMLRRDVIPARSATLPGVTVDVTGYTAEVQDFNDVMKQRAPIVVGFVLVIAFVLLLVSFRSLVIAVKAIVLNLLSVAAAYGLLVLVFQHHWAESLLGFQSTGSIAAWLPLFLFVILFGLSMDYHVFILSRMREAHDRGQSTRDAVAHGITSTAGVVTAAAVVMVFVFLTFAHVVAGLVQADRARPGRRRAARRDPRAWVLLPSTMTLLGEWNWYLPRWLDWLPQVSGAERIPVPAQREPQEQTPVGV